MNKREEEKLKRQQEKLKKELERTEAMSVYEKEHSDCQYICGIDEVGRGPFAGPVVAGAVILPKDDPILYLNDSKKLSEKKREALYDEIMERAVATGIGVVSPARIDEINILQATYEAMRMAIGNLKVQPDLLLNDAVTIPEVEIPQVPIIKGDAKSVSIAAASIIAKVTRDRLMVEYDKVLPGYDFASNKGYGTKKHIEGLKELGYKVPKDYSVVGFDGLEVTNYTDPAITTIDQNIQQKGYEATRLLCDMIRGKRKAQRLVLPHTLTVRDSVRPL